MHLKISLDGDVPSDVDQALYDIHQVLGKKLEIKEPFHFYNSQIKPLWETVIISPPPPPPLPPPPELQLEPVVDLISLFQFTKNVIIYGPPGTGKTYIANLAANELIKEQLKAPVPEAVLLQSIAEANTFYDLLALGMYTTDKDKHYTVKEILGFTLNTVTFYNSSG